MIISLSLMRCKSFYIKTCKNQILRIKCISIRAYFFPTCCLDPCYHRQCRRILSLKQKDLFGELCAYTQGFQLIEWFDFFLRKNSGKKKELLYFFRRSGHRQLKCVFDEWNDQRMNLRWKEKIVIWIILNIPRRCDLQKNGKNNWQYITTSSQRHLQCFCKINSFC